MTGTAPHDTTDVPVLVAAVCRDPLIGDLEANRALAVAAVGEAAERGAGLIVLPELITSGYVFKSRHEAASVAIDAQHELMAELAAAASGAVVVAGFCEQDEHGRLFNSAVVLEHAGVRAVYRKTHLWDREKLVFAPGAEPPPVVETTIGRIGVLVCYDLEFPEMPRGMALRGADIIAVPTNWPLVPRPPGEHPPEVIAAMAAARTNHVFIACADRAGTERHIPFTGGTCLIDPEGWLIAATPVAGLAIGSVDPMRARQKSIGPRNDVLADRRPDLYRDWTATREEIQLV
ncbi:MAG: hypothetical protein JO046_06450 [Solirubrobacterales bacterium]|nr:hypothetical protein [Solirubrobacterales bacterium]MBV9681412.1 hypothetical protein [Solirubrobacterales bacterium]